MPFNYTNYVNPRGKTKKTPQTEPIPGKEESMVANSAGGYSFALDDWKRLDRFLVLGSEGGTYYIGERQLTKENAVAVQRCIDADGVRVVNRVVEISDAGRAPKNEPALFVLAMCAAAKNELVRKAALAALPKVARIGTHLFHFAEYVQAFRGWGRGLRNAVGNWYNNRALNDLVLQVVKYKQRDGWSHRDLLRLSHPKADSADRNLLYKYVTNPEEVTSFDSAEDKNVFARLEAATTLATEKDAKRAVSLIREFRLPREVVNTELLNEVSVWDALLQDMPLTAMVRNLGKMTSVGLLKDNGGATLKVVETLGNKDALLKARVHPLALLVALMTYKNGHGDKGSLTWNPAQDVVDALNDAFYLAFDTVVPTGKRLLLGLDVSDSMSWGNIAGMAGVTPNIASAVMSMVTARVEKQKKIMAFADNFRELGISAKDTLEQAIKKIQNLSFGGTDCSLPMRYALENKLDVDAFFIYTDSETWAGGEHPVQTLQRYRDRTGIPAKLIVVGMQSNGFTIADPNDGGMLDVVGFDTAAPNVMSDFVRE